MNPIQNEFNLTGPGRKQLCRKFDWETRLLGSVLFRMPLHEIV